MLKESFFHRDLSSSWFPDNKMILSKDRYGYFLEREEQRKPTSEIRITRLCHYSSRRRIRLLSSKWLAKISKKKGRKFRGTPLFYPFLTDSFSKVNFLNSIIRSRHLKEIGRFATYKLENILEYVKERNIETIISIVVESINTIIFLRFIHLSYFSVSYLSVKNLISYLTVIFYLCAWI